MRQVCLDWNCCSSRCQCQHAEAPVATSEAERRVQTTRPMTIRKLARAAAS